MRKYIDILNEALDEDMIDKSATPPEYEDKDAQHYEARRKTGFFGAQAAGCILMAKTTGRVLIVLRSSAVDQPHTYGNVGGAFDAKEERPIEAARREAHEETGYTGSVQMIPLMVFSKGTFRYSNFLAIVEDEFKPHLGWEADKAVWVEIGRWPSPLHFGLKSLFADAASMKTIKHYADMFRHGKTAVESVNESEEIIHARGDSKGSKQTRCGKALRYAGDGVWQLADGSSTKVSRDVVTCPECKQVDEDLNLPAGVDIGKAIGAAKDLEKQVAADGSLDGDVDPATPPAPGQPATPAKPGQQPPAPAKKSLAPIRPQ